MTSANFTFVMCDVCQMPSLPSAKFFAECKFRRRKFRRMPNFAACWVFKVPIFLNAEFATCQVFPSAQFFRLLRAEFAKSRVLSNARYCHVTACRRLPAVKSSSYEHVYHDRDSLWLACVCHAWNKKSVFSMLHTLLFLHGLEFKF